jgi:aspartyl-tRNA(Asn)/glutamyl-tRNA(Gln) amidotransferase subunit B
MHGIRRGTNRLTRERSTATGAIDAAIAKVLATNTDKVAEYKGGRDKLFGFSVGRIVKVMAGKGGNPALVNEALRRALL